MQIFGKTSNYPGDSALLQPRFGAHNFWVFSKTKITFEREAISDCKWNSGKYDGAVMAIGRTVWGPKVPTLKGTDMSLSHVLCSLHLVSSSINVSSFHFTWVDATSVITYFVTWYCALKRTLQIFYPLLVVSGRRVNLVHYSVFTGSGNFWVLVIFVS